MEEKKMKNVYLEDHYWYDDLILVHIMLFPFKLITKRAGGVDIGDVQVKFTGSLGLKCDFLPTIIG
ncbi:hypothetical protein DERP_011698 [Dermatophagoides pteronyssinus]|uniref:Uncharacterized protein n=1 Tax=Dermatophagoides pteronyssinus TaxID=6956 RepID=A0ABQ8J317_DERPT|nr:hypothetical protein DERP_011698 [Dermatophagoides pteronyssinus]